MEYVWKLYMSSFCEHFSLCFNVYNWRNQNPFPSLFNQMLYRIILRSIKRQPTSQSAPWHSFVLRVLSPNYAESTLKSWVMSQSSFVETFNIVLVSIIHYLKGSPTFLSHQHYSIIYAIFMLTLYNYPT